MGNAGEQQGRKKTGMSYTRIFLVLGADGSGVTAPLVWTTCNQLQVHDFYSGENKKYTLMITEMLVFPKL